MKISNRLSILVFVSILFFACSWAIAEGSDATKLSTLAEALTNPGVPGDKATSSHWISDDTSEAHKAAIVVLGSIEAGPRIVGSLREQISQENLTQFIRENEFIFLDRRQEVPDPEGIVEFVVPSQVYQTLLHLDYTAVAIGPRVLLTAAHNVTPEGLKIDTSNVQADCDVAPGYTDDESADLALCYTQTDLGRAPYEPVFLETATSESFTQVTLSGFGCTDMAEAATGALSYRSGVMVKTWPSSDSHFLEVGHCLCPGDSGGPVFANVSSGRRMVVAVNARGRCRAENGEFNLCSEANINCAQVTSTSSLAQFIKGWAEGKEEYRRNAKTKDVGMVKVCGVNTAAADTFCR